MKNFLVLMILYLQVCVSAQTQTICGNSVPVGWAKIGQSACNGCCPYNTPQITIKKISGLPSGSVESICSGESYPMGWAKIGQTSCNGCCGYSIPQIIIKRIDGLPVGAVESICSGESYPVG